MCLQRSGSVRGTAGDSASCGNSPADVPAGFDSDPAAL